jgi:hypothetical protein
MNLAAWRRAFVVLVLVVGTGAWSIHVASAAADAGGGASSQGPKITAKEKKAFSEAPPVVVKATDGLPAWYLANPLAKKGEEGLVEEDEDVIAVAMAPDARHLALTHEPTAVDPGFVEVLDLETGSTVNEIEYEGDGISNVVWAPDGSALAFDAREAHHATFVGGETTTFPLDEGALGRVADSLVVSSDDESAAFAACLYPREITPGGGVDAPLLTVVTVGDEPGEVTVYGECDHLSQLTDEGDAVAMAVVDGQLQRILPSGELEPAATPVPESAPDGSCGGSTISESTPHLLKWSGDVDGEHRAWVYSLRADTFIEVPLSQGDCPVPSPDGEKFALAVFESDRQSTVVADFTTGEVVEVARTGRPIAWSAEGDQVLVEGNGTFVVEADGSGGDEASVQLSVSTFAAGAYCRAGDSGLVVLNGEDVGLVLYDVSDDEAIPFPKSRYSLSQPCYVSADGRWLISGHFLIDLRRERTIVLPDFDGKTGRAFPNLSPVPERLEQRLWYGEQQEILTSQ